MKADYSLYETLKKNKKVTTYEVAQEIGLYQSLFSELKKGKSTPKYDKLKKIADYFGVNVNYFYE